MSVQDLETYRSRTRIWSCNEHTESQHFYVYARWGFDNPYLQIVGEGVAPLVFQTIPDGTFDLYCFVIRACWRRDAASQVRNAGVITGTPWFRDNGYHDR